MPTAGRGEKLPCEAARGSAGGGGRAWVAASPMPRWLSSKNEASAMDPTVSPRPWQKQKRFTCASPRQ